VRYHAILGKKEQEQIMPTDILIYMIIAGVMVFWLKNVIGTRHGEERERPNPYEEKETSKADEGGNTDLPPIDMNPMTPDLNISEGSKAVDAGLVQIALADRHFDVQEFKENAGDAFAIIVEAFASGDRDTLKDLCAKDVYDAFDGAITDRENKGEKVETEIHAVREIDIVAAGIERKKTAFVTVRFTADETYVISDNNGEITAGHPDRVTEMTDKWTFTRDLKSSDPRWFLSKPEDDVIEEDGKTPVPDAG
jgi:predicted lipid-binding transport protein (Tim44 family)